MLKIGKQAEQPDMTALSEYERLEATGLWRAGPDAQRLDVIVAIGDATLTITDSRDRVLAHWSLAAVARANKGNTPAIFHPDGDPDETLELPEDEAEMIAAIDKLRRVIENRRPKPGRLRLYMVSGSAAAIFGLAVFWMPNALLKHTVNVVPAAKRADIGAELLGRIIRVSGQPCTGADALPAMNRLSQRLLGQTDRLVVLPGGVTGSSHLPGGKILLNRGLVEDWEDPEVPAGFILSEATAMRLKDPLDTMLRQLGLISSLRLLTTGGLTERDLQSYAEWLLVAPKATLDASDLIPTFTAAQIHSSPYAYALDVTGEKTLDLIEADPMSGQDIDPVLTDGDWVRLQGICGA